ncbi:hypothetical protein HQ325_16900 [Rhodococcus sp. BP-349]|uniref:hypothetical protein n=1 Tax=unclassified Rhodococcus (in: high G+C Gram-positive bacteria) TaxID=192944 RepID=UPI001C9B0595|nr:MULTISPECIES: hypothetical protein [unclassified Rhodococcus (in: high G+C Gram-positive bacteria)]MBY6540355.1 hypothetical protein [Rhodococcus sp. BP-363]MBY6545620.1 hypothetical protein [Rhodococcus sp. BP-369]MBY6564850.1 hypothetical protein [Rhodococcus sp. BP-370]MBY6578214.1 hypothetical protein [Rhodococcus sp. BP-364]MBY6587515.1 hypothetical protein [Rhodococcus sp. BP-358]
MSAATIEQEYDFVLSLIYGQFYIRCGPGSTADWDLLVQDAIGEGSYAGDEANIVVISPVSYNAALPVGVEIWTAEPPSEEGTWPIAIRHQVTVGEPGRVDLDTTESNGEHSFPLRPESYVFEVLGYVEALRTGRNESATQDRWKVRVWPTSA